MEDFMAPLKQLRIWVCWVWKQIENSKPAKKLIASTGGPSGKQGLLKYVYENGCYKLYTTDMFLGVIKQYIADYDEELVNFSRGDYKCRVLLQTKRGAPVAISEHKETGIWKVTHGFSTVAFGTKAEALAYCRGRFLDLDGRPLRDKEST